MAVSALGFCSAVMKSCTNKRLCSFIIDGIITIPIALYGFLVFPDVPATTKAFYMSEEVGHSYSRLGVYLI